MPTVTEVPEELSDRQFEFGLAYEPGDGHASLASNSNMTSSDDATGCDTDVPAKSSDRKFDSGLARELGDDRHSV